MKFLFEVATIPVAVVTVSSISVCIIARVVVEIDDSTTLLQGYVIKVIARVTYMGIAASMRK